MSQSSTPSEGDGLSLPSTELPRAVAVYHHRMDAVYLVYEHELNNMGAASVRSTLFFLATGVAFSTAVAFFFELPSEYRWGVAVALAVVGLAFAGFGVWDLITRTSTVKQIKRSRLRQSDNGG